MTSEFNKKVQFIVNALFYALIAVIVYFVIKYAFAWALPFIIGALVALITRPLVRGLKNKLNVPEGLSSIIFALLLYAAIAVLLFLLVSVIYDSLISLKDTFPYIAGNMKNSINSFAENISEKISTWPVQIAEPIQDFLGSLSENVNTYIVDFANTLKDNIGKYVSSAVSTATKVAGMLPSIFLFAVALVLSSIYISRDMSTIKAFIYMQLPEKQRLVLFEAREFIKLTIFRYLRAYATIMTITFCELFAGFLIIGIPYPFLIALAIAIVDILPVFGCGTVLLPWTVIEFVNQDYKLAISLLILYLIITVIRQFVEPKVVGSNIGLNPLITLFCIYVGFKVMGVLGMFVFPILLITLRKMQESGYLKLWNPLKNRGNNG